MRPILLLLLCVGFPAGVLSAQRHPEIRVDRGTAPGSSESWNPALAVEGEGVFAAWMDYRNGDMDIYFNRSLDGGRTWLANDVRLDVGTAPGSSWSSNPVIAVSGGVVVVAWRDFRGGTFPFVSEIYANRSLDGGATWLASDILISPGAPAGGVVANSPSIGAEGSVFCVSWEDTRNGNTDIYFNRSSDGGTTWLPSIVRLDTGDPPGNANSIASRLVVSGVDVHVVWADLRNNPFSGDIYYNHSGDLGTTWLPAAVRVDHFSAMTLQGSSNPSLAAEGSQAFVVWNDNPNDPWPSLISRDVYFNRTLDGGQTWLATDVRLNTSVSAGTTFTEYPKITSAGTALYTAWVERVNPTHVAFNRSLDLGTSWLASDVPISHPPAGTSPLVDVPFLAATGSVVVAVWGERRDPQNGDYDAYYNRSPDAGTSWLSVDRRINVGVPAGAADAFPSQPVFAGDAPYVAWQDSRNGLEDIYLNLPFGYLPFGAGTQGSGGIVPTLRATGLAMLGQTVDLRLDGGLGGAVGLMALGVQKVSTPVLGGTLLVDPLATAWFTLGGTSGVAGSGSFVYPVALPSSTGLLGLGLFGQGFALDPAAPGGLSMSDGIEVWIG